MSRFIPNQYVLLVVLIAILAVAAVALGSEPWGPG